MSRPEELRQITENTLHSLIADESLKFKILQKAASSEQNDMSRQKRIIPAFCTVLAFLLIAAFSLNSIRAVPKILIRIPCYQLRWSMLERSVILISVMHWLSFSSIKALRQITLIPLQTGS